LDRHYYDAVVTFNRLKDKNYALVKKHYLAVGMLKSSKAKNTGNFPILINRDISCPLRKLSIQLYQETRILIETDTLNNILSIVKQGDAIALLPLSLAINELTTADEHSHDIIYYEYKNNA
jgi:LysR family transcriptional regulator, cell division regulator